MDTESKSEGTFNVKTKKNNSLLMGMGAGLLLMIVIGGVWYIGFSKSTGTRNNANGGSGIAATVNGEEISLLDFNMLLDKQKTIAAQSPNPVPTETLRHDVLDSLIVEALLLQKAKEAGIFVPEERITEQMAQVKAQFPDEEAFNDALTSEGLTVEKLQESMRRQLQIQAYLDATLDLQSVTVTDEEIQVFYDQVTTGQEGAPELETVRDQIETQLVQQKQSALIFPHIEQLKSESDIQTFLEPTPSIP